MRINASKKIDSRGEYFTDFGIQIGHMSAWGYIDKAKYPEVWEVEIEPDENQEGIGDDWDSTEYFGFVPYPKFIVNGREVDGDPDGFDENGTPKKFRLIQRNFTCYHIQFPYGYEAANLQGKHYRLKITPIKRLL